MAAGVLLGNHELVAPDLILVEVANALGKKVRDGLADKDEMATAMKSLPRLFDRLVSPLDTLIEAFEIGCGINHPIYDCVYLACAKSFDATLVTDDDLLVRKIAKFNIAVKVCPLVDWPTNGSTTPTG
jgi:predicted nucleic acid-binding protein